MKTRSTWLPAELLHVQPYSMGPLVGWNHFALPPDEWGRRMDAPELMIRTCFWAPMAIQRQAQRAGQNAIIMMRPKGLVELIEADQARRERERGAKNVRIR